MMRSKLCELLPTMRVMCFLCFDLVFCWAILNVPTLRLVHAVEVSACQKHQTVIELHHRPERQYYIVSLCRKRDITRP
jgi:hypothetical protein